MAATRNKKKKRTGDEASGQPMSTAKRKRLDDGKFAFKKQRKEPLNDASHVRNAIARFDQVTDVTDAERDKAWKRILKAAKKFDVEVSEGSWRELGNG